MAIFIFWLVQPSDLTLGSYVLEPFFDHIFEKHVGGISQFVHVLILLNRGFNDAVNCLSEDGWALMNPDALGDVVTSIKRTKNHGVYGNFDSVICVKSSLLLQVSSKHIFSPNAAFNFL